MCGLGWGDPVFQELEEGQGCWGGRREQERGVKHGEKWTGNRSYKGSWTI